MDAKRVYLGLVSGIIAVGLLSITALVFGSKLLNSKSSKLVNLRLKQQVLIKQESALVQANQDILKYTPLNDIAKTVVPQEKDQALTVREITNFATNANIAISSVTFPSSSLGGGNTSGSPSGTDKSNAPPPPSQLQNAKGIKGIYVLPITLQSDITKPISYDQLETFLQELENNRHTAEVSQLTISPTDTNGQHLSFAIVVDIYVK